MKKKKKKYYPLAPYPTNSQRFTKIIKTRPQVTAQQRTETMLQQQQVSAANRRLAMQMENRMTVQAAINTKQVLFQLYIIFNQQIMHAYLIGFKIVFHWKNL